MTPSLYDDVRWAVVKLVGSFEAALVRAARGKAKGKRASKKGAAS